MTRYVTSQKVAVGWLATLPGITADMVDTVLPEAQSTWAAAGFITPFVTGGSADVDMLIGHPVVTLKCWAVDPDTGEPPWNIAENLAETVRNGCFNNGTPVTVTLPDADQSARVLSAYLLGEPRPVYGDIGDFACYITDLALHWAASG